MKWLKRWEAQPFWWHALVVFMIFIAVGDIKRHHWVSLAIFMTSFIMAYCFRRDYEQRRKYPKEEEEDD